MPKSRRVVAVLAGTVLVGAGIGGASVVSNATAPGDRVNQEDTFQIARLTGPGSINATHERWNVYGTDLGSMFEHRGQIYQAFGDTFGAPGQPPQFGVDWRSNVMAFNRDRDPWDGLTFEGMITDEDGNAKELLESAHGGINPDGDFETTVIPTYGVSDGKRMYLHYKSVREFGVPGEWTLNYSAIAYSDDDGETWVQPPESRWDGDSNFGQAAIVKQGNHAYFFGIPAGRFGGVQLARVEMQDILDNDRYQYWDGDTWRTGEEEAAETIVPAPVGELSVRWNSHYKKWLMMYLNDTPRPEWGTGAVVIRTADCLTGPWSEESVVVTSIEVPQLYAPYMPPRWNNGPDIFFTLSRFNFYDVFWWHTSLTEEPAGTERAHPARCVQ